ncbi:MAG: L-aspartate oxidase [Acidobacteria bacterium RIFCSPLOWO2_02_FULL_67_21]|nr:MAG: L-aspartate oxidase [Acidobacteria bacterium RIFCSPLOWO2_02_FULL_67_21]
MDAEFLVIGSGIAGLRAAFSLAERGDVIMLTKADPRESNTGYAQGGIAAAIGPDDSPALHARDTMAAGDGLCAAEAVDVLVREGPRYVRELIEWGAAFDREASGQPALGREAAHSVRRVLHAKDATGREIARLLGSRVSGRPRVRVMDDAMAVDLTVDSGTCSGATFVTAAGVQGAVTARQTLLATGGAGQVFRDTTNPAGATGDGIAIAARAGARVMDLEFVQFHPTVLNVEGAPRFLLSEALRGEGGRLINDAGEAFMERYEPAGDLASRDLVARAMFREVQRTGAPVYLTMAHLDAGFVRTRFPTISRACANAGLDLARDRIPVSPAAHYLMGGVTTDLDGRTSLPGLFAAGEVACTGVHGANRLASNSLLEGLVFGARASAAMQGAPKAARLAGIDVDDAAWPARGTESTPSASDVRDLMWRAVGLVRARGPLHEAVERLAAWVGAVAAARQTGACDPELRRLANLATVGWLIARAALRREESRGAHFRSDFPSRDDLHWKKHIADRIRPA